MKVWKVHSEAHLIHFAQKNINYGSWSHPFNYSEPPNDTVWLIHGAFLVPREVAPLHKEQNCLSCPLLPILTLWSLSAHGYVPLLIPQIQMKEKVMTERVIPSAQENLVTQPSILQYSILVARYFFSLINVNLPRYSHREWTYWSFSNIHHHPVTQSDSLFKVATLKVQDYMSTCALCHVPTQTLGSYLSFLSHPEQANLMVPKDSCLDFLFFNLFF